MSIFDEAAAVMQSAIFDTFAETSATLAGSPVTVVIDRNIEVMSGGETESYARVTVGTFPADVTPIKGQQVALSNGETFRVGDEISSDGHQKQFVLK